MITIKNIAIKNFMSVGNVTQSINFIDKDLVLVLGENLDMGGNDSRNGVGKSTIVNALSYAFYGAALTNIRKDNLINKTNAKNMVVTLEFEKMSASFGMNLLPSGIFGAGFFVMTIPSCEFLFFCKIKYIL